MGKQEGRLSANRELVLTLRVHEIWTLQEALKCWLLTLEGQRSKMKTISNEDIAVALGQTLAEDDYTGPIDLSNQMAVTYADADILFKRLVETIGDDITL